MARPLPPAVDPAADAAALLRRLGWAILTLAVPVAALVTRRGIVVLGPIGIALILIAAGLDGGHRRLGPSVRRLGLSAGGLASLLVLAWCILSLLWTPFTAPAVERLANIAATIGLAVAGYLALPDRMRSANLYLLPVGVGLAAALAILIGLFGAPTAPGREELAQNLDRGLTVLALLVWPAVAWLRSRGRPLEALALAVAVAVAEALGPRPMPLLALSAGAALFGLTAWSRRAGVATTAGLMAGILVLAPLMPLVARPVATALLGPADPLVRSIRTWYRIVVDEPVRLITGHGFETALRGRLAGLLPSTAPTTLPFEVWYELGLVGALAGAAALYAGAHGTARAHPPLVPGIMAAFATAYAFACLGIGTAQMWWFTALAVLVLIFVAVERGQFRTTRPKARLLKAANDA